MRETERQTKRTKKMNTEREREGQRVEWGRVWSRAFSPVAGLKRCESDYGTSSPLFDVSSAALCDRQHVQVITLASLFSCITGFFTYKLQLFFLSSLSGCLVIFLSFFFFFFHTPLVDASSRTTDPALSGIFFLCAIDQGGFFFFFNPLVAIVFLSLCCFQSHN